MFAVVVTLQIAPRRIDDFLPLIHANARASMPQEPGCHEFDVATDAARSGEVLLFELYDDRKGFDAHLASAHFGLFNAASADMILFKNEATYAEVT